MTVPGNLSSPLLAVAAAGGGAAAAANITKSVRFNSADSAYLDKTFSSASDRRTWTWAGWVKRCKSGSTHCLFFAGTSNNTLTRIIFDSDGLNLQQYDSGSQVMRVKTDAVFRDPSAWYHIVAAVDTTQSTASDRVNLYVNGVLQTSLESETYPSQNLDTYASSNNKHSIGVEDAPGGAKSYFLDGYLADVYFIGGSQLDCTSFGSFDSNGVWQAAAYSGTFGTNGFHLFDFENITGSSFGESWVGNDTSGNGNNFTANNIIPYGGTGSYTSGISYGNRTLTTYDKDDVVDGDLTNGYIDRPINNNGLSFSSIPQASTSVRIHCAVESGTMSTNAGTLTTATGSDVGVWKTVDTTYPFTLTSITVTGGSSSDGFYIYGIEVDGVVLVDTTSQSAAAGDLVYDVPVNGSQSDTGAGGELSSNYATFNPLSDGLGCTVSNGNLQLSGSATSSARINGTIGVSSGKWYFEVVYTATDNYTLAGVGQDNITNQYPGQDAKSYAFDFHQGKKYNNGSQVSHGSSLSAGDIFMCALDLDNNKIFFGKNGTFFGSGNPATGANPSYTITAGTYHIVGRLNPSGFSSGNAIIDLNAGQRAYSYSAPTAFKSWNTSNLPTPTIADGSAHFESKLYTGNGSTNALTMSNSSMSPDIVWIHERSTTGDYELFDSVRGANKVVETNSKNPQATVANTLTSFDSNGFTLGSSSLVNDNNVTYVGWSWDSGSSNASNTTGSINSTCRTNIAAGISIVTYTGSGSAATVGHSLGVVPEFIVIKNLDASKNHIVYHAHMHSSPAEKAMNLNETSEIYDSAGTFNDTAPTSTVFSVGTGAATNASGEGHRALCFAPVSGFSAMGKYDGTGDSNTGAFNYTGMRPAWVMIKRITNQESWVIYDTSRNTHNPTVSRLYADLSNAESDNTSHYIDILSNGFRVRSGGGLLGFNNNEYLWVAFAEHPFQANGGLAR